MLVYSPASTAFSTLATTSLQPLVTAPTPPLLRCTCSSHIWLFLFLFHNCNNTYHMYPKGWGHYVDWEQEDAMGVRKRLDKKHRIALSYVTKLLYIWHAKNRNIYMYLDIDLILTWYWHQFSDDCKTQINREYAMDSLECNCKMSCSYVYVVFIIWRWGNYEKTLTTTREESCWIIK